jgi:hypothetical protein
MERSNAFFYQNVASGSEQKFEQIPLFIPRGSAQPLRALRLLLH